MGRKDFLQLLARSVRDGAITEGEAAQLLSRFDAGELNVGGTEMPLPESEVVKPAALSDIERAVAALLAIGSLKFLHRKVRQARETLQDTFQIRAATLAKRYTAGGSLKDWQGAFRGSVVDNIIQQRAVGSGRIPTTAQVGKVTLEQSAYVSRFAEELALKKLAGEAPSYFQMAARSALYAGVGRAEGYRAEAEGMPAGTIAQYVANDDGRACGPCSDAEGGYPIDEPFPLPGEVCDGYGHCRCRIEYVSAA